MRLRRLSCLMGLPRDLWPGIQGFIPLSFNASLNQPVSYPRLANSQSAEGRRPSSAAAPV
jgi:hypothetical protein